jgi:hypothetical protein
MVRTTLLFAALLLAGLASASAFDFSELPDELLEALKDQVAAVAFACSRDGTGSRQLACHVHGERGAARHLVMLPYISCWTRS